MALDEYEKRDFKVVGKRMPRPDAIDKVTGRALYGADMHVPGMLVGKILRSPHAHARIKAIDISAAEALEGVRAVVTGADFPEIAPGEARNVRDNAMARDKALYDGHAVAAVAATSAAIARKALKLIRVEYEILPHVTEIRDAMKPGAPVVQEGFVQENVPE
ncbi:MAG: xanthine dehydrogenase family protein molybdopterin-binding subunit, partial [Paracoccaceae bacterium]|nr:xanthine dehydrogenase family protein molybdopterin-binding subunit [Paracoccaceae bacterium]